MRVLVAESDRGAADHVITDLQGAGHHVVRCHEPNLPAFPCNALCDGGTCSLDTGDGIDVVLDFRVHPYPRPTPFEDGVSCALRRHVPLVIGGTSALNPFAKWTTDVAIDDDRVVEVCEQAADAPRERLATAVRDAVRTIMGHETLDVSVRRSGARLKATVVIPDDSDEVEGQLAVAVAGALRARDPWIGGIDVAVRRAATD
jgi:hypothetical protein